MNKRQNQTRTDSETAAKGMVAEGMGEKSEGGI